MTENDGTGPAARRRLPPWLKRQVPKGGHFTRTRGVLAELNLDTVCSEAKCPNRAECFARGTATFLVMGPVCTRGCAFCSVTPGAPTPLDPTEPRRVAEAVKRLGVRHCVITSVTRDDLADGGASHFAECIAEVKRDCAGATVEVLTPDFRGDAGAIGAVVAAHPDVYNHNVETVPSLYPSVRPGAAYERSLSLLRLVKELSPPTKTKSGIMLGLGENEAEVEAVLRDLRDAGVDFLTIGQYLKPSPRCVEVKRYVTPEEFERWRGRALEAGFLEAASGPFVRSSYRADEMASGSRSRGGCR